MLDCCQRQADALGDANGFLTGFNPCCVGLLSETGGEVVGVYHVQVVSILVVLDCCQRQIGFPANAGEEWFQSLLCWIVVRDTAVTLLPSNFEHMFQSLLCWIVVRDFCRIGHTAATSCVSILVVLDCCQRLLSSERFTYFCSEFQSLLCWIVVRDPMRRTEGAVRLQKFQSLLCWIVVRDSSLNFPLNGTRLRFNPCCVGLLSETIKRRANGYPFSCFNPCCVGLLSETRIRKDSIDESRVVFSILVVLDCCQRLLLKLKTLLTRQCFNPCCVGLLSETALVGRNSPPDTKGFNPCCVGLLSETSSLITKKSYRQGFNPCCVGLLSETQLNKAAAKELLKFSILVVLDCCQRQRRTEKWRSSIRVFNPCCVGLLSETPPIEGSPFRLDEFQSLLCWIVVRDLNSSGVVIIGLMFQSLLCWIVVRDRFDSIPKRVRFEIVSILVVLDCCQRLSFVSSPPI